jgi:hypothetical protein|uniref:Uncharacterized protein n=1 Tax=viral metagenome TaxID=1070528 RepID=A0A6C0IWH1_9ZZZZ
MSDNQTKIIKISDYYKDFNLPEKCFNSDNLKNLLELSAINKINLFKRNNNSVKLNNTKKIINECTILKKIKLKEFTKELEDFNLSDSDISIGIIKTTNDKYINNLENIDNIIKIINTKPDIDYLDNILNEDTVSDSFIEIYSNN